MATKDSTNPKGVCEKLFDAISVTPAYLRRISHHPQDPASHAAPSPSPAALSPSTVPSSTNTSGIQITHFSPEKSEKPIKPPASTQEKAQNAKVSRPIDLAPSPVKKVAQVVPTKAGPLPHSLPLKTTTQKENPVTPMAKASQKIDIAQTPGSDAADGKSKTKMNAGTAMKAVVQHGKEVAGKVHLPKGRPENEKVEPAEKGRLANINEKASDYIARAKYKIRTTTTLLGGGYGDGGLHGGGHGGRTDHDKE